MNKTSFGRTISRLLISALALGLATHAIAQCQGGENTAIEPDTPTAEFFDFGDGTVLHRDTQLVWMRCAVGQSWNGSACADSAVPLDWAGALSAAENATDAGHSDWRLPNRNELASIVETRCHGPAINGAIFSASPITGFWTSSPVSGQAEQAWLVLFINGTVQAQNTTTQHPIRLVRGGRR